MKELNKVKELEKVYKSVLPLKPEDQKRLDKKFMLEFNYNTNHLEGNTLTYGETELLLIFEDTKGDHNVREYDEMRGSDVAFKLIQEWARESERPITEQQIKELNEVLLVRPFWKDAETPDGQQTRRMIKVGDYKEFPNSVRLQNGEIFDYASPADTPILMAELIQWYRDEEQKVELHPVILAALFHYKFVRIHPFDDGNGRISRLLMNYVLIKNNLPPVVIKSADKSNYLMALNRADAGDLDAFCAYVLSQFAWSLELCIKAAKGESLDELGDLDKKIKVLMQKLNPENKKVTVKASRDTIVHFFNENIYKILNKLESKLSNFDSIFKSSNTLYEITSKKTSYSSYVDQLSFDSLIKCEAHLTTMQNVRNLIEISFSYSVQNSLAKKPDAVCRIAFIFHLNMVEIRSSKSEILISKLYDETFLEVEINSIVEKLGNTFLNDIESLLPEN